jgi:hypothetical protein
MSNVLVFVKSENRKDEVQHEQCAVICEEKQVYQLGSDKIKCQKWHLLHNNLQW